MLKFGASFLILPQWSVRISDTKSYDLDLVPPVLSRTLGNELSPSGTIVGSISRVTPVNTQYVQVFFQCVCHVLFGLPTLLLPPSGIHSKAKLAGLVVGSRRMWPTNRLLMVATVSCSAICSDRAITSSFVMWSRHEMPNMLLRHRRWKTSIILLILLVVFHVSLAYIPVGMTMDEYRRNLTSFCIVLHFQMGCSRWNTDEALPNLARMSTSTSPFSDR